ncbi:MAG: crotonase/enoyl-CoA hydratase family protein [Gammaproteobacteria bacterium]
MNEFQVPYSHASASVSCAQPSSTRNFRLILEIKRRTASWVLRNSAPSFVNQNLIGEMLDLQRIFSSPRYSIFRQRVIRSNVPGVFSLGGDLAFFKSCVQCENYEGLLDYAMKSAAVIRNNVASYRRHGQLTICVVQGEAQGGGFELALSSHVVIAERGTRFGFPEPLFGLFPGMGARQLLESRIGAEKAKAILGGGRQWTAEELFYMGIIDFLADPGKGTAVSRALTTRIGKKERDFYGHRFSLSVIENITCDIPTWTNQALNLSPKNLRTIDLILHAQAAASNRGHASVRG